MNEQQTFHINMTNRQLRWERGQHALAPGGLASATRAQRDACDHVRVSRREVSVYTQQDWANFRQRIAIAYVHT